MVYSRITQETGISAQTISIRIMKLIAEYRNIKERDNVVRSLIVVEIEVDVTLFDLLLLYADAEGTSETSETRPRSAAGLYIAR